MEGKSIFISSCSRRQLARRRPQARAFAARTQLLIAIVVIAIGFAAFLTGHGGL